MLYRFVTVASTDGGDFQMKTRVSRMTAIIDEICVRFFGRSNLGKNSVRRMLFSEMGAETALTLMHV
jgi:GTP-binding protein EngB required for normal cell division